MPPPEPADDQSKTPPPPPAKAKAPPEVAASHRLPPPPGAAPDPAVIDFPPPAENARPLPEVAAERSCSRSRRREEEAEEALRRRPVVFWTPPPPPPMIFPVSGSRATAKALGPEVAVEASAATGERKGEEEERARAGVLVGGLREVDRGRQGVRERFRFRRRFVSTATCCRRHLFSFFSPALLQPAPLSPSRTH